MTAYDILGIVGLGAALYGLVRSLRLPALHPHRTRGVLGGVAAVLLLTALLLTGSRERVAEALLITAFGFLILDWALARRVVER
ncbi:MAG: hypothetical protein AB7N70_35790 [Dehalococcoidia bacterium]